MFIITTVDATKFYTEDLYTQDYRVTKIQANYKHNNIIAIQNGYYGTTAPIMRHGDFHFLKHNNRTSAQEGLLRCLETRAHKNSHICVTIFNTGSKFQPVSNFM